MACALLYSRRACQLRASSLSLQAVLVHSTELASGLAYLHACGVVHRDIKPANCLMTASWALQIGALCRQPFVLSSDSTRVLTRGCPVFPSPADFGLAEYDSVLRNSLQASIYGDDGAPPPPGGTGVSGAEQEEDLEGRARPAGATPTGGFHRAHCVGTLAYTAPEVLRRRVASFRSDVFSLAVTCNELATRRQPYADRGRNVALAHTVLDLSYNERDLGVAIAAEGLRPSACGEHGAEQPRGSTHEQARAFDDLVASCWAAEPADRPSCGDVEASLRALCSAFSSASAAADNASPPAAPPPPLRPAWLSPPPPPPPPPPPAAIDRLLTRGGDPLAPIAWPPAPTPSSAGSGAPPYAPVVAASSFADCGLRGADKMEDAHVVLSPLRADAPGAHLFCVFDGHRGAEAAGFAAASLSRALLAAACGAADGGDEERDWDGSGAGTVPSGSSPPPPPPPPPNPAESLLRAFVATDAAFAASDEARCASEAASSGKPRRCPGAAACCALLWGSKLYVANAGDCRAVLCRGGTGFALSRDHTADDPRERQRIEQCGGSVARTQPGGQWRVGGAGLAVTRALGDADCKPHGVTAEPEISMLDVEPDDEFLIIACDGLWDVMDEAAAVALVRSTVREPGMAARRLVTEAMARGSTDNVTAVLAFLRPVSTCRSAWTQHSGDAPD